MSQNNEGLNNFLKSNKTKTGDEHTHTKIPDKKLNIYPGSFKIEPSDEKNFYAKYYKHVFAKNNFEYLTEKQLRENGPIMIDIDLRYQGTIREKQHTKEHIIDIIMLYAENISKLVTITRDTDIEVFVMEKNDVNHVKEKNITKDGIHIIIGVSMHKGLQVVLRNNIIAEISNIWDDLPITNSWDEVFDEGITKGHVNWQMYGSRKPGNQPYLIKQHYILSYNSDWDIQENDISDFNTEKNLQKLSARYTKHPSFEMKEITEADFNAACKSLGKKKIGCD